MHNNTYNNYYNYGEAFLVDINFAEYQCPCLLGLLVSILCITSSGLSKTTT